MNGEVIGGLLILALMFMAPIALLMWFKKRKNSENWMELLAKKHPELFKELTKEAQSEEAPQQTQQAQQKEKAIVLPTLIPKKVKVVVLYPDRQIEAFGRLSRDGNMISVRNLGTFTIPKEYRPKITWSGRKTYLTFYFTPDGQAIEVKETGQTESKAPDPAFSQLLVDKGLVARIFRLGLDWSSMMTGLFLGAFVFAVLVFFILPMIGIPVIVGREAIQVQIQQTQTTLPPPGNFTIP